MLSPTDLLLQRQNSPMKPAFLNQSLSRSKKPKSASFLRQSLSRSKKASPNSVADLLLHQSLSRSKKPKSASFLHQSLSRSKKASPNSVADLLLHQSLSRSATKSPGAVLSALPGLEFNENRPRSPPKLHRSISRSARRSPLPGVVPAPPISVADPISISFASRRLHIHDTPDNKINLRKLIEYKYPGLQIIEDGIDNLTKLNFNVEQSLKDGTHLSSHTTSIPAQQLLLYKSVRDALQTTIRL